MKGREEKTTISILGNGPYATEVADQLKATLSSAIEFDFIAHGDDEACIPDLLAVGIANPSIKRKVIDEFYWELEPETFIKAWSTMVVISKGTWLGLLDGRGTNIGPFTAIGHNTEIRDFVSICSNVTIGHDCAIGDFSTICPGAVISGNVTIGEGSFIGAGAVIKDKVSIGKNVVIGCGAVVVSDIANNVTVTGNPAKEITGGIAK